MGRRKLSNKTKITRLGEKINKLGWDLQKLAEKEFGSGAYIFISDDGTLSICDKNKFTGRSVHDEIVHQVDNRHPYSIGSW
jgi:hypothetical protein